MMNTLQNFEAPIEGEVTVCEVDGLVHTTSFHHADPNAFTNVVDRHPKIHITRDLLHPTKTVEEGKDLFLPVQVPFLKLLTQIYYEHGTIEVLEQLSCHHQIALSFTARLLLTAIAKVNRIKTMLDPSLREPGTTVINRLAQTRNWSRSPVRCLVWHPVLTKIAVAASDDTVRILTGDSGNFVPILKCRQQKNITCMAWRPMSNSDIAVACEGCIIVWNVDPNSVMTRPSMNHTIILIRPEHRPVLCISWSPRGDILASVAAHDSKILLWDVELDRTSTLKRAGSIGHNLLKWSSDGDKLFAATTSHVFRVWDTNTWQVERWNVAQGRVQAACWSPNGKHLIFSTSEEPIIYALTFATGDMIFSSDVVDTPNLAIPLYDVAKVDVNGVTAGGIVQSMDWDPKGNNLAVIFYDTSYVATFAVITFPVFKLSPGCLINGNSEEVPNGIAFQQNFEHGACLTINWSSGRVQHFPIVYTDVSHSRSNMQKSGYDSYIYSSPRSQYH